MSGTWYCGKCRMTFRVGSPTSSQRPEWGGCPDCGLWFGHGYGRTIPGQGRAPATVFVMPEDLAKHKARQRSTPAIHESYVPDVT